MVRTTMKYVKWNMKYEMERSTLNVTSITQNYQGNISCQKIEEDGLVSMAVPCATNSNNVQTLITSALSLGCDIKFMLHVNYGISM